MGHYERYMVGLDKAARVSKKFDDVMRGMNLPVEGAVGKLVAFLGLLETGGLPEVVMVDGADDVDQIYRYFLREVIDEIFKDQPVDPNTLIVDERLRPLLGYIHKTGSAFGRSISRVIRYGVYVYHFEREGRRTYRVSDGLATKLNHTILKGLKCSDIRLPYEALYIERPKEDLGFRIWNEMSGWHEFEGAYLCMGPTYVPPFDKLNQDEVHLIREEVRSLHVLMTGGPKGDILMDDAVLNFTIKLPDDADLETQVKETQLTDLYSVGGDYWEEILRWLINVMIYATWNDCERDHLWVDPEAQKLWEKLKKAKGKKAGKIQKQLNGRKQDRYYLLGKSIKINRTVLREGKGTGSRGPVTVQSRVAGHWKKQAHGPGRKERKLIWIDPYWRGPEDSPVHEAVHVLSK